MTPVVRSGGYEMYYFWDITPRVVKIQPTCYLLSRWDLASFCPEDNRVMFLTR
jgi:hypothetical protein